jgi:hypothetical protein
MPYQASRDIENLATNIELFSNHVAACERAPGFCFVLEARKDCQQTIQNRVKAAIALTGQYRRFAWETTREMENPNMRDE